MQHRDDIRAFVHERILDINGVEYIPADSDSLLKSGLINSLAIVEIITFLEDGYAIDITDGQIDMDDFDSIENIFRLVERVKNA